MSQPNIANYKNNELIIIKPPVIPKSVIKIKRSQIILHPSKFPLQLRLDHWVSMKCNHTNSIIQKIIKPRHFGVKFFTSIFHMTGDSRGSLSNGYWVVIFILKFSHMISIQRYRIKKPSKLSWTRLKEHLKAGYRLTWSWQHSEIDSLKGKMMMICS